jgi:hypothetical protein
MWINLFRSQPGPWLNDPSPQEAPPTHAKPHEPAFRERNRRESEERTSLAEAFLGRHFRPRI